jgi:hypothetical protein
MRRRTSVEFRRSARLPSGVQVGLLVMVALLIAGAFALMISSGADENEAIHSAWQQAVNWGKQKLQAETQRPGEPVIYPYSVVPGGVHSLAELRQAMKTDPVVASAYAKFNLAKFQIVKLSHEEYAYVSYRIGSDVFWTTKRLRICKGETLVTDGEYVARTRCGNQLSRVPHVNTWSSEPPAEVLNTPAPSSHSTEAFAGVPPDTATLAPGILHSTSANLAPPFFGGISAFVPFSGPFAGVIVPGASGSTGNSTTPVTPRPSAGGPGRTILAPPPTGSNTPPEVQPVIPPVITPSSPVAPSAANGSTSTSSSPETLNSTAPSAVPEESSWVMLASGFAGLAFYRRLVRRRHSRTGR